MILKIKVNGKVYGLEIYENNENGEITVLDSYDPDTQYKTIDENNIINDGSFDDILGTNEQMITIILPENPN